MVRSSICRRRVVLLVGDVLAPSDLGAGLVGLLHGGMHHEAVGRGTMPVVLPGLEEDAVAGTNGLDWTALTLAQTHALSHEDRLAEGMGVPSGAGTGRKVDRGGSEV